MLLSKLLLKFSKLDFACDAFLLEFLEFFQSLLLHLLTPFEELLLLDFEGLSLRCDKTIKDLIHIVQRLFSLLYHLSVLGPVNRLCLLQLVLFIKQLLGQ